MSHASTFSLNTEDGTMSASIVNRDGVYVLFGSCTLRQGLASTDGRSERQHRAGEREIVMAKQREAELKDSFRDD